MAKASLGPWDTLPRWVCSSARAGHTGCWPSAAEPLRSPTVKPHLVLQLGYSSRLRLSPTALGYNSSLMVASLGMRAAAMGESSLMCSLALCSSASVV